MFFRARFFQLLPLATPPDRLAYWLARYFGAELFRIRLPAKTAPTSLAFWLAGYWRAAYLRAI